MNYSNGILKLKDYQLINEVSIFNIDGIEMVSITFQSDKISLLNFSPGGIL